MDEITISISDVLASVVRRGKRIICCGIVLAVLLGGFKGFTMWNTSNREDYVDLDLATYEQEKQRLERVIEQANQDIQALEEYITNSLWMHINPFDKHVTEIHLMASNVDESELEMTFGDNTTPRDYMLSSILHQYSILWNAENLPAALKLPKYETAQNKYLREIVWAEFLDGGVIQITALGKTKEESAELADAAAELMMEKKAGVEASSFKHTLNQFNAPIYENQIDNRMADTQYATYAQVDTYNKAILDAEKELRGLEAPDSIQTAVIKMFLVGGILGGVLACAWYAGKMILVGSVQSSAQIEQGVAIPFAGILRKKRGIFYRLANWVAGERGWKNEDQALDHIAKITKLRMSGDRLLLTSSLVLSEHEPAVENLIKAFSSVGVRVDFEGDFFYNANAFSALKNCDGVLLLEQVDSSRLKLLRKICKTSQEQEKPVVGFVLV